MVGLVEFHRDAALRMPGHEALVLTNRALEVPRATAVHAVEPENRHRAPGVVDRVDVHLGQAKEIVTSAVGA